MIVCYQNWLGLNRTPNGSRCRPAKQLLSGNHAPVAIQMRKQLAACSLNQLDVVQNGQSQPPFRGNCKDPLILEYNTVHRNTIL